MRPRCARALLQAALLSSVALAACGGSGGGTNSQNFATCGNARLDAGEVCDDGNLSDSDACTTACRPARCGDGVVEVGVEDCDPPLLVSCALLGRAGNAACDASCRADYSVCGELFTPTPTPRPPTPTPTSTPTPALMCGDGLLTSDETCDSCPADCTPQPCNGGDTTAAVSVVLSLPAGQSVNQLMLSLSYRTSVVSLPNTGLVSRFERPAGVVVQPTDKDYAVDVRAGRSGGLESGPLFTVTFDRCAGAAAPRATDFDCSVTACAALTGCSCRAEIP